MNGTLKYAEHKLDEAIKQGEPDETIAYWRGYRDCAKALEKDRFTDTTKMVPLTLEQLRKIDGWPVCVKVLGTTEIRRDGWCEVEIINKNTSDEVAVVWWAGHDIGDNGKTEDYGKTWLCYAYPPAHIDREAWEPCGVCNRPAYLMGAHFCWHCGRPLTEEAWAELEKRMRG